MKKNWVMGFLGIAVILFSYVGLPYVFKSAVIITLGFVISFISFRGIVKDKIALRVKKNDDQQKTEEVSI